MVFTFLLTTLRSKWHTHSVFPKNKLFSHFLIEKIGVYYVWAHTVRKSHGTPVFYGTNFEEHWFSLSVCVVKPG
jgi:hypothetical protein